VCCGNKKADNTKIISFKEAEYNNPDYTVQKGSRISPEKNVGSQASWSRRKE